MRTNPPSRVVREFRCIQRLCYDPLRNCTVEDLLNLLGPNLHEHVYIFNHLTKSVEHPSAPSADVPWPLQWLLTRYHRKHILYAKGLPSLSLLIKSVQQTERKLEWRWALADTLGDATRGRVRRARSETQACQQRIPPEARAWIQGLGDAVVSQATSALRSNRFGPRWIACP